MRVLVDFTSSGISPGLSEHPGMNPGCPLKGWKMGCGRDVCPASGGLRSWLGSSDTAIYNIYIYIYN